MISAAVTALVTSLLGAAQGLAIALFAAELARPAPLAFHAAGAALALALASPGLAVSLFGARGAAHGLRAAAHWRNAWLTRAQLALAAFMAAVAAWGAAHAFGLPRAGTLAIGALAVALDAALFLCTGMIYACVSFVREWATPLTPVNFALLGAATGFTLAVPLAVLAHPPFAGPLALAAFVLAALAWLARGAAFLRNARLRPLATTAATIGVPHPRAVQSTQGSTVGSFDTRESFRSRPVRVLAAARWMFLVFFFPVPGWLLGWGGGTLGAYLLAFLAQLTALIAERWLFFAEARHPHNL